ncbi:MAG: class I mannose-6-phosphate isomerase [Kiritimatiellia bacterium]|jgi:mannose-6-phosphate isomerase|nr:class I mannose-6-phosphate isomerase [Kiritimatiellia bacterium]MDP6810646.1 class I mannose-6-phosphate isomerase [Kiritimatiellia bacterium]MDP7023731.1 class I mannose-6-phosphate isomerase [Kiritimatiellia bacterium]
MNTKLYPLLLTPVYKDYIWGGTSIPERFNREPQPGLCAESWELCDHADGMSIVSNGPLEGATLHDLVQDFGPDLVGTAPHLGPPALHSPTCPPKLTERRRKGGGGFPLLIKIIDAAQKLSVQVHPNDQTAPLVDGEAKSEMWYLLDGAPGARFYAGLIPGTTPEAFDAALEDNTVHNLLKPHDAAPGTLTYIRGGCVHAIGEGCLILEVQQNSNTTYRVYDWDRVDAEGNSRELHIEKARQVIDWELDPAGPTPSEPIIDGPNRTQDLLVTPYFRFGKLNLEAPHTATNDGRSFHMLFVAKGTLTVSSEGGEETVGAGTTVLLPAAISEYTLIPGDACEVLRVSVV